jgi:hypothetical protein
MLGYIDHSHHVFRGAFDAPAAWKDVSTCLVSMKYRVRVAPRLVLTRLKPLSSAVYIRITIRGRHMAELFIQPYLLSSYEAIYVSDILVCYTAAEAFKVCGSNGGPVALHVRPVSRLLLVSLSLLHRLALALLRLLLIILELQRSWVDIKFHFEERTTRSRCLQVPYTQHDSLVLVRPAS